MEELKILLSSPELLRAYAEKIAKVNKALEEMTMPTTKEIIAKLFFDLFRPEEILMLLVDQTESVGQLLNFIKKANMINEFEEWKNMVNELKLHGN